LSRYSDSPVRYSRREIWISEKAANAGGAVPSLLSNESVTSAIPTGASPSEPAKITSSMPLPRSRRGACSPITQRIASTTFDLPQPFGPTTPVMPGLNETTVLSTNDLKPWSSSDLSRT
jgi:hypothetical protein